MTLCHDLETHETRGFLKGGPKILEALAYLRSSDRDIIHPMLLPVIVLSLIVGSKIETLQHEALNQIRLIEVQLRNIRPIRQAFISEDESIALEAVNADLAACHRKVWKRPETYVELFNEFYNSLDAIACTDRESELFRMHLSLRSRVELLRQRMRGIQSSAYITLDRINMQRSLIHNILLNQQNQIALQIEKRKQKQETMKELAVRGWNRTQLLLSLLGSIFLPMTVVAVSFPEN